MSNSTMRDFMMKTIQSIALGLCLVTQASAGVDVVPGEPGAEGGLAILTKKALCVPLEGQQVVNNAVILIRDGKIEAVGPRSEVAIPPAMRSWTRATIGSCLGWWTSTATSLAPSTSTTWST